jgi:hypothetical protein
MPVPLARSSSSKLLPTADKLLLEKYGGATLRNAPELQRALPPKGPALRGPTAPSQQVEPKVPYLNPSFKPCPEFLRNPTALKASTRCKSVQPS